MDQAHLGSDLDDLLRGDGMLEEVTAVAVKRVIALRLSQEMERHGLTKVQMARRMRTSRAALDRLLDPANTSVTLLTLERAASAVGMTLKIDLLEDVAAAACHRRC